MRENINIIKETFSRFKRYELTTFVIFILCAIVYSMNCQWFEVILSLSACVWVHNSAGWRQTSEDYKRIVDNES